MTEAAAAPSGDNGSADNAGTATQSTHWTTGFDEPTMAYVGTKGWQSPTDLLTSYRNLEKFAGGSKNLVELPGVDATDEVMGQFYDRLGRPATADQYSFKAPEGADPTITEAFKGMAHKYGLSDKAAAGIFGEWNQMVQSMSQQAEQAAQVESENAIQALRRDWGSQFDAKVEDGKRAAALLGYDQEKLNALESKMGTADLMHLMVTLGSKMGEASLEGADSGTKSFGLSPIQAKQQIADLKMDKQFMDAYLKGDKDALAKMQRLMGVAHGG